MTTVDNNFIEILTDYIAIAPTEGVFSVIDRNIPITHNPSRKIHIQYKYCNNLFMHKGQDQVNIVEVYSKGPSQ